MRHHLLIGVLHIYGPATYFSFGIHIPLQSMFFLCSSSLLCIPEFLKTTRKSAEVRLPTQQLVRQSASLSSNFLLTCPHDFSCTPYIASDANNNWTHKDNDKTHKDQDKD